MPVAWLCDFDGTVSPRDIGAAFVERFSPRGDAARVPELGAWLAGRAGGEVDVSFPFADPACESCGNCKAGHVRRHRALGLRTVLVGDGLSDRHGALAADHVLARGSLRDWCVAEGVPHRVFRDFAELIGGLAEPAAPSGATP